HIARYLSIYHPEAGFEITDTHQYEQYKTSDNINKNYGQARVLATKKFKTESIITHLMGLFSPIDEELLDKLKSKGLDFSVMISSRTNKNCLLLGPARFVNHDCNPNAKFHFLAPHIITFKVIRNIQFGEEITVSYGDNYFGENNKECLCSTCKRYNINY
ncbi:SET domain-containing protein, partial [Neoconidiobolus thromboides FSU 785]